ncbi:hypothetical protein QD46_17935 [Paenibacillus polymyxa]|nr:hypothetical protein QD46_17935 [Paenibacillus polymyxa]
MFKFNEKHLEKSRLEKANKQRLEFRHILVTANAILKNQVKYANTHPIYTFIKNLVDREFHENIYRIYFNT